MKDPRDPRVESAKKGAPRARIPAKQEREQPEARAYAARMAPFHFDAATQDELRRILGDGPIIKRLEATVMLYRQDPELDMVPYPRDMQRRVRHAHEALERLTRALSDLPEPIDYVFGETTKRELRVLRLALEQLATFRRRPGQKTPGPILRLEESFRRALESCGLPFSATHGGKTEAAFRLVYEAATGRLPGEDVSKALRRAKAR